MSQSVYHSSVSLPPCMPRPSSRTPRRHHDGDRPVRQYGRRPSGRRSGSGGQPHYGRRRAVAALLAGLSVMLVFVTLFVAVVAIGLLAGSGGRPASASRAEPANTVSATHVALDGDSLWSIAEANRGEVGMDRYVDALIDLNGGTDVQVGQAVLLP